MIAEITPAQSAALDAAGIGTILLCSLAGGAICGFIGAFIGHFKNRKALGLFLGMVFGPLGWLFTLFARDGERDEGVLDAFTSIVAAILFNAIIATVLWKVIARPIIDHGVAKQNAQIAKEQAEHEKRMAEIERRTTGIEREPNPVVQPPRLQDLPQWDRYGNPINRSPTAAVTPGPRITPRPRDPRAENSGILQRYGTPR